MKMIKFLSLVCLVIFSQSLVAQSDAKASKIIKDFEKKFESLDDVSGTFKYGLKNVTHRNKPIVKEGEFKLKKKQYFVSLDGQEIYCDGKRQWVYLVDDNEVTILPYDPEEGVDIESVFKLYKASAKSRYEGTENISGRDCHKIYLAFTDEALDYNQAMVWIDTKDGFLRKAVTIDRRQTETTYEFLQVKTDQGLKDNEFQFNQSAYPGIIVYDDTE